MGPSGSGKSTLMHLLAGLDRPTSGTVELGGRDITAMSDSDLTRLRLHEVGFVFQAFNLLPVLTAEENVALPLLLGGARRAGAYATAHERLDRLGVDQVAHLLPGEMSGGQLQRVALARALVTGPAVLFADEPTGALDSLAGERVLTELVRESAEHGTTIVLVTHDGKVAAYAHREIALRDGALDPNGLDLSALAGKQGDHR
jgi:putative ABC transport system ATP-binding protein